MSGITTHILDTAVGKPATGVHVVLDMLGDDGAWRTVGNGVTDADGRIQDLLDGAPDVGIYRLIFSVASYFADAERSTFYPKVTVEFVVADRTEHYHVPLLLNPFGYATYRGS